MSLYLLKGWDFWSFPSWTPEQTSAFWTALGAIGTVGTLIYVLIDAYKNRKKINDLANIAKQISDQNDLILVQNSLLIEQNNLQKQELKAKVRPDLVCKPMTRGAENLIVLTVENMTHSALVTNIEFDESQITFNKTSTPFKLGKNEGRDISGYSNGQEPISLCTWNIKVHFTDIYGFPYILSSSGQGAHKTSIDTIS